jgi:hypothetical protein
LNFVEKDFIAVPPKSLLEPYSNRIEKAKGKIGWDGLKSKSIIDAVMRVIKKKG